MEYAAEDAIATSSAMQLWVLGITFAYEFPDYPLKIMIGFGTVEQVSPEHNAMLATQLLPEFSTPLQVS